MTTIHQLSGKFQIVFMKKKLWLVTSIPKSIQNVLIQARYSLLTLGDYIIAFLVIALEKYYSKNTEFDRIIQRVMMVGIIIIQKKRY